MTISIHRDYKMYDNQSLFGIMYVNNRPRFVTVENFARRIPEGKYIAKRDWHYGDNPQKKYEVWELQNVVGRTQIQIHIANFWNQLEGCIAVGDGFMLDGMGVQNSTIAFNELMRLTYGLTEIEVEVK